MTKNKEDFKVLSPRDHCRTRPGMYIGNVSFDEKERFILGEWEKSKYVPALLKMIDEILDNSIDEAIRTNFKHANIIDVSIDGDTVIVSDNGRGIPQDTVVTPAGEEMLRPAAAWTVTNAGTSFGENRTTIGSHGLGSALVTYFSKSFVGKTWRDGQMITVDSKEGCDPTIKNNPKVKVDSTSKTDSGTIVKFTPDFSLFEADELGDTIKDLVLDRLTSMAICFPKINFKYNKVKVGNGDFKKYAKNYGDTALIFGNGYELQVAFTGTGDGGFKTNSYINGVHTIGGGAYVDFVANEVADTLIPMIKRKHKININKQMIKNHLTVIQFANGFENPKFDSQTKERLTNTVGEVKQHFAKYGESLDFTKIAKKILSTEEIIEPMIQAELAKRIAAEKRAATKAQNKLKKAKVAKHVKANKPGGYLFLAEGDSASGAFLQVRDNNIHGCLPLRGVVRNVWEDKVTDILGNKEMSDIISCLELDISDPDSIDSMYYDHICILVDADHDGMGHIAPLLLAFFYRFWPRLFEEGRVHIVRSPILIIHEKGKKDKWAYDYDEAAQMKIDNPKGYFRYIKGLGSLEEPEYEIIINNPKLDTVKVDDKKLFDLMFGKKNADDRKDLILG